MNSQLDPQDPFRDLIQIQPNEALTDEAKFHEDYYFVEHVGRPGDGSGTDDLADYNANEADDYRDE